MIGRIGSDHRDLVLFGGSAQANITFSTFVTGSDLIATLGQQNTIAFNYAGNKFVGSVYGGPNNLQLYSTNLNGGNVQKFGDPLPSGGGEVVIGASLGKAGFAQGDVYAGPNNQIYHYGNGGGSPILFGATDDGSTIRQIFFDPGSSFGGKMLVTTTSGHILSFDSSGNRTLIANLGSDTEGMDIASTKYGQYAGQLLVASEGSTLIHAVSSTGVVTTLMSSSGGAISISVAETVSTVPLNFGQSGDPLEGFYVANYATDIQKAGVVSEFAPYLGDSIVTSEFGSNSAIWDLSYNGDVANTFTVTQIGTLPGQSEDGIFVTSQRIIDVTPPGNPVPEPAGLSLLGLGALTAGLVSRRRRH